MKKLFLLLIAIGIIFSAVAQETMHSGPYTSMRSASVKQHYIQPPAKHQAHNANRGNYSSSGTFDGWYEYMDYMNATVGTTNLGVCFPYLWNDTSSVDAFMDDTTTGTTIKYLNNDLVSYSSVFDPYFSGWEGASGTYTYNPTSVIPASLGYTVDAINIYGIYGNNPAKTGVVDTIKIGYVYGSGYHYAGGMPTSDVFSTQMGSEWLTDCLYDSATNTGTGVVSTYVQQILLIKYNPTAGFYTTDNTTMGWYDTSADGINYKHITLNTPAVVPAGNLIAFTFSFKSGDPAFTFGNTVFTDTGYNFNMWRPEVVFYGNTDTNYAYFGNAGYVPAFWTYDSSNHNGACFKTLPNYQGGWENLYTPNYAWSYDTGSASALQYPVFDLHALAAIGTTFTPAVKGVVNKVSAAPNPASDIVAITFSLATAADVSVSLTDMMGQVVAIHKVSGLSNGNVQFSTAALPSGVYFYTLSANGQHTNGKIAVTH